MVEQFLKSETIARTDHVDYVGRLLVRQQHINEAVLGFVEDKLKPGDKVLDACAGPQGSLLAASLRHLSWFGNDISMPWSQHLKESGAKNLVISDFVSNPFTKHSFDATLFIFALNNIVNVEKGLSQANRVTKPNGLVIVSDPGPTVWASNLLLYGVARNDPALKEYLRGKVFQEVIPEYLKTKPFLIEDYVDTIAKIQLGTEAKSLAKTARQTIEKSLKRKNRLASLAYYFNAAISLKYFQNIDSVAKAKGLNFTLNRAGYIVTAQDTSNNSDIWFSSPVIPLNPDSIWDRLANPQKLVQEGNGSITEVAKKSGRRVIAPVLVYQTQA